MIAVTTVPTGNEIAKSLIDRWATDDDYAIAKSRPSTAVQEKFLLTRAALRAVLAQVTGADGWLIRPNHQGKPQTFTVQGVGGPHVSLSHTHGLVGCAISLEAPIGFDLEFWKPRDFISIASYAFGPREREEVASGGASAFYRIWTLKEALSKKAGGGLIAAIDGLDHFLGSPAHGFWMKDRDCFFYTAPCADYSLAIACEGIDMWSDKSLMWVNVK